MAFSYDPTLAANSDLVRLALGDVTTSDPLFTDDEVAGALTAYGSVSAAAAALADAQAAKYSRRASMSIDGASIQYRELSENFRALAANIRANAVLSDAGSIGSPFVGGVSIADMDANDDNTDRTPSRFKVGQFDFPGTTTAGDDGDSDDA